MRFPGKNTPLPLGLLLGAFDQPKPAPAPPPIPPIPEPAVAPVPDDEAIKAAKRRKFAVARQRSGRLSTINTEPTSTVLG